MLECLQASTYTTVDFQYFLRLYFKNVACVLCGRLHPVRFHGFVRRLIRIIDSQDAYANAEIRICVIICPHAKRDGMQYTKRMLPPFVIPECNITLENAWRMYHAMPAGGIDYQWASELLKTYCAATIRRHYIMIAAYVGVLNSLLARYLSLSLVFMDLPEHTPEATELEVLLGLCATVYAGECKRLGGSRTKPKPWLYLHAVYRMHKSRTPPRQRETPSNLFWGIRWYFDSS